MTASTAVFTRTRYTLLAYFMLAYYSYLQGVLGPLMPFLSSELHLTYTEAGAHFSAFAAGMVISSASAPRISNRFGRRLVFWTGGIGMALFALVLISAQTVYVTVPAAFLMGTLGTLLLVVIQASLADAHGRWRTIALTEANMVASLSAAIAPLLVGTLQQAGVGWRGALVLMVTLYLLIAWWHRDEVIPTAPIPVETFGGHARRLPRLFWVIWGVIFLTVAAEWSIGYWGAEFLTDALGVEPTSASTAMSAFFSAAVVGRLASSRLVRRYQPSSVALLGIGTGVAGFLLFWQGQVLMLNLVGLFIAGLGIGSMFPLGLTLALNVAPEQANVISGRVSLAAGSAILIAPQMLGILADRADITAAYGMVFVLLVVAAGFIVFTSRQAPATAEIAV